MKLTNSYVMHHYWSLTKKDYIEGTDNHIQGAVVGNRFKVYLTNSFGDPTSIKGHIRKFGPLWILKGLAHGYKDYPQGMRYTGFGLRLHSKRLYLGLPTSLISWLEVRLDTL